MKTADLVIEVRLLTAEEGGRQTSFYDGYRGQFYYDKSDWLVNYTIVDATEAKPGDEVRLEVATANEAMHYGKFKEGKQVQIREGPRVIAEGKVIEIRNEKFAVG